MVAPLPVDSHGALIAGL